MQEKTEITKEKENYINERKKLESQFKKWQMESQKLMETVDAKALKLAQQLQLGRSHDENYIVQRKDSLTVLCVCV